jgi:hypothetical protein
LVNVFEVIDEVNDQVNDGVIDCDDGDAFPEEP